MEGGERKAPSADEADGSSRGKAHVPAAKLYRTERGSCQIGKKGRTGGVGEKKSAPKKKKLHGVVAGRDRHLLDPRQCRVAAKKGKRRSWEETGNNKKEGRKREIQKSFASQGTQPKASWGKTRRGGCLHATKRYSEEMPKITNPRNRSRNDL